MEVLKPTITALRRQARSTSVSVDLRRCREQHPHLTSPGAVLFERDENRLNAALDHRLEDEVELLEALLRLSPGPTSKHDTRREAIPAGPGESPRSHVGRSPTTAAATGLLVGIDLESSSQAVGTSLKAQSLHGRRKGASKLAVGPCHPPSRRTLAKDGSRQPSSISCPESAVLDRKVATGPLALSRWASINGAFGHPIGLAWNLSLRKQTPSKIISSNLSRCSR